MAIKQYYGSKISDNITKLENGCLLCLNVPIARTGTYKYLRGELGLEGSENEVVTVYRSPEDVFDQRTIASFNGSAFTDNHPPTFVTVDNWAMYSKGEVTDVRRGKGDKSNLLLADILVRDPITINEIESGAKREVSSGYECNYVERGGKIYQTDLRGNHVALVSSGRAGPMVRINDSKKESRYNYVRNLIKAKSILNFILF